LIQIKTFEFFFTTFEKKLIILFMRTLSFIFFFITKISFAQTFVSTSPSNKVAVIEEFTGIHCGYCPDGHVVANNILSANPNGTLLMNIHSGSFAIPSAGEPDLRTTEGTSIDGSSGVTGYPVANVNRANTPWSMSRSLWASSASSINANSSPVNIAVKCSVDLITRVLTTEVEIYYTANSATSTNKLTVALLQNNILGPQTDYGNYNPTNWLNGKYKHNHVLRKMLHTGGVALGMTLDTTTAGKFYYKKFTTTLPASITSVPLNLFDLEVVAHVAQSTNSNILTGAKTLVWFDNSQTAELGMIDSTKQPNTMCVSSIQPKVEVVNNSSKVITSFDLAATVQGVNYIKSFSGSLSQGQKTIVDIGLKSISPSGTYSYSVTGFTNINGNNTPDVNVSNNSISYSNLGFSTSAYTNITNDFQNATLDPHFYMKPAVPNTMVLYTNTTADSGGAELTKKSLLYHLHSSWGINGQNQDLITGEANFFSTANPFVSFYYAYSDGFQGGSPPVFNVMASENCGSTWTLVNTFNLTQTGNPKTSTLIYKPASTEFIKKTISLAAFSGKKVIIKFVLIPGTSGNAAYLDQIKINGTLSSSPFLLAPNGGENWKVGSIQNINWIGNGVANLKIDYTSDNGNTWNTIVNSVPGSSGSFMGLFQIICQIIVK
jgi:hypothetical protein